MGQTLLRWLCSRLDSLLPPANAFLCMLACVVFASPLHAQPKVQLSPPKDGQIDKLVPVMAQSARCIALSENLGWLAFGHDPTYPAAQVSLVKLDAKGNPAAYSIPIKTPKPEALAKLPHYGVNVCFHPKLPLLYIWQDIVLNYTNPPAADPPGLKDFDHLLVYSVAKETPELVTSFCRGPEFIYGQSGGSIFADANSLYVPNLRELKNPGSLRMGRFHLDADGLPDLGEKDGKLPLPARIKRLAEINAAKPLSPHQLTPIEYVNHFQINGFGCGLSIVAIAKDVIIASNANSIFTWRPVDKVAALNFLPVKASSAGLIAAHPKLPALFATGYNTDSIFRAEQVEGYLTSLPKQFVLPETKLTSLPAVMTASNKVAVGGQHHVYLISLDDKGFPQEQVVSTRVLSPMVRALVYSERFDRLYVGVDVSK